MKDPKDSRTLETDAFPLPPRRGRPSTGKAKTNAQRQADFRQRRKFAGSAGQGGSFPSALHNELLALRSRVRELETDLEAAKVELAYWWAMHDEVKSELVRFRGCAR